MKDPLLVENAISELTQHVEALQRDLAAALKRIDELERRPQYVPFPFPPQPAPAVPHTPWTPNYPWQPGQPWYIGDPPNYTGPTCSVGGQTVLRVSIPNSVTLCKHP